jgi:hypothetical protein
MQNPQRKTHTKVAQLHFEIFAFPFVTLARKCSSGVPTKPIKKVIPNFGLHQNPG